MGRTRALEGVRDRPAGPCDARSSRSRAGPAARRQLYKQLCVPFTRGAACRPEMVSRLADLAAGSPAHLRILHLMSSAAAAFRDGVRRVNSAPIVVLGMSALTLLMALPLALALASMLEAHLG